MNKTEIINKYKDFIFEIQIGDKDFFIYQLNDFDFVPHDKNFNQDLLYLTFESYCNQRKELIFEINLGVDVLAIFEKMVGHFSKTIRVECTESEFEFSENSCIILKNLINEAFNGKENFLNKNSVDSIKTLEPYYFNNIRFI